MEGIEYDYLIVGQGIAGTMLSYFLIERGKRVLVIDAQSPSSASNIAAGIINPITGRRFVKSWKVDTLLPFAIETYEALGKQLNDTFFTQMTIRRVIDGTKEQNDWLLKSQSDELGHYISRDLLSAGSGEIIGGGQVNMPALVRSYRDSLNKNGYYLHHIFEYNDLIINRDSVIYGKYQANKIIFCEGYKSKDNQYFNWLPFVLAKGELLTVKIDGLPEDKILSKGIFILPLGDGIFKVGATYDWDRLDEEPTPEGKEEIVSKLEELINMNFEVIDHHASVRPTVKDRRPLIGVHPKYPSIGIFNGLGTKGALLAPYFAKQFTDHLEDASGLDDEVNINRFISLFAEVSA